MNNVFGHEYVNSLKEVFSIKFYLDFSNCSGNSLALSKVNVFAHQICFSILNSPMQYCIIINENRSFVSSLFFTFKN